MGASATSNQAIPRSRIRIEFAQALPLSLSVMRCDSQLLVIAFFVTVFGVPDLCGEGGIVLEKPYPWSAATEVVSVKEFSSEARRGNFETGYNEYFIGPNGKRFAVQRDKIAKVIFYPNVENHTDIQDDVQLAPILSEINELRSLSARYGVARPYLDRQINKLEGQVSLFRQGARKIGGTWHSAEEIARKKQEAAETEARKRQEAADLEAKLQAARKAEEEKLAAARADAERAAMERKAAAEVVLRKIAAAFKKDATDMLTKTSLPSADFKEFRTLNDVQELAAPTVESISALAQRARTFREKEGYESVVEACRAEIASVSALEVRSKVAKQIRAGNAAGATVDINSFYKANPSPPSDAQKDLWRSLASIRTICNRLEEESKTHLERGQSLSASGKSGEAIQEFQKANQIFPDPKIAERIRKLREDTLGL